MASRQSNALPSAPVLVVSPHFDDAAFSCAALLSRDEPTDVLTVFTRAPNPPRRGWWDEKCGFRDSSEAVAVRRREEHAALAGDARRLDVADLVERQYLDGARDPEDERRLTTAVSNWLAAEERGAVALPVGAGWRPRWLPGRVLERLVARRGPFPHEEHLWVRDTVLRALPANIPLLLYEELPYLWAGRGRWKARSVDVNVDRERKARRIAAYATQVPHMSPPGRRLDDPEALPPSERYWVLTA